MVEMLGIKYDRKNREVVKGFESDAVFAQSLTFRREAARIIRIAGVYWPEGLMLSLAMKIKDLEHEMGGTDPDLVEDEKRG